MPKGVPNKRYTPEFKKLVVETMQKEKLNYCETARQFEISDHKRVSVWERIYMTEGPKGFAIERRGRGSKDRPPKQLPKDAEEDLLAEVQSLRAKVEYLKNCKPWFWKTSDANTKNAGSSEAKADSRSTQQRSGQLYHIGSSCTQHGDHHAGRGVCKNTGRDKPGSSL